MQLLLSWSERKAPRRWQGGREGLVTAEDRKLITKQYTIYFFFLRIKTMEESGWKERR